MSNINLTDAPDFSQVRRPGTDLKAGIGVGVLLKVRTLLLAASLSLAITYLQCENKKNPVFAASGHQHYLLLYPLHIANSVWNGCWQGKEVWVWRVVQVLPEKLSRRPGRGQGEESRWWREEDLKSCNLCALVFHFYLRKGSSLYKTANLDRLWINRLQSPMNYVTLLIYC